MDRRKVQTGGGGGYIDWEGRHGGKVGGRWRGEEECFQLILVSSDVQGSEGGVKQSMEE